MKINLGDGWRGTFKRSMWGSVVLFEIAAIFLSIELSKAAAAKQLVSEDNKAVIVVLGIIIGTFLNEIVHALWACVAYMFEDIARNREASERIAQLLEIQENRLSGEESAKSPAVENSPVVMLTSDDGSIRFVSGSIAQNDKADSAPVQNDKADSAVAQDDKADSAVAQDDKADSAPAQDDKADSEAEKWECPKCRRKNPMTALFCRNCGRYR